MSNEHTIRSDAAQDAADEARIDRSVLALVQITVYSVTVDEAVEYVKNDHVVFDWNLIQVLDVQPIDNLHDLPAEAERWRNGRYQSPKLELENGDKYMELLMAVERKHPNETRHETALRYIKEAEHNDVITADSCLRLGEQP